MVYEKYANMAQLPDTWNLLHGDHGGHPMLVRLNTGAAALAHRGTHDIRIGVAVPFNEPDPDGLPEMVEGDVLTVFEDLLIDMAGNRGTLVAVITAAGMREFVLYASDEQWIDDFQRALKSAMPSHQVQVVAERDPEWDLYRSFQPWPTRPANPWPG
ncbi:MAG: DUF695 domain-containing protein [Streptosporangiales bacterium]|nr:DUF695 domain-containing protein [Streptosporangiales bacterium]